MFTMDKKYYAVAILTCIAVVITVLSVWVVHGSNILTKDKVQILVKTVNPNFGTEEEHIEWKDEFHLGLDIAGPVSAVAILGALGAYILMRRKGLQAAQKSMSAALRS